MPKVVGRVSLLGIGAALLLGGTATAAEGPDGAAAKPSKGAKTRVLEATIRRTKFGVPHIRAKSVESLAAGYAHAFAEDNICTIANEYVTVSGERSKYFGPDGKWTFSGNGTTFDNIDADVYFKWAIEQRIVPDLLKLKPPLGPKKGVRKGVAGYVKGYNDYLRDVGVDDLPDPTCRGADWVRPISKIDVYRRFFQLGILASSGAVINGITDAEPVSTAAAAKRNDRRDRMLKQGRGLEGLQPEAGSNAYGFGREATTNGRGLVLGNPHFPWHGSERLYQAHLQIPGKLNVEGGSLYGVPLILIGWTKGLAWSHTVATAWRFTPFKLTLAPGDPHSYVVDGETRPMEETRVQVEARTDAGIETIEDTIYSTEYGPMIDDLVGIPLPWTEGSGYALRDVNATNFRYLNHFFDNNKAESVTEYDTVQRRYQGVPWVNSIAADSKGNAYYSMQGAIPNVSDELAAQCNVLAPVYSTLGLPVLDGSRSACNWEEEPGAVAPGTFPAGEVPTMARPDYVHNGNDSHWLTNPEAPMTGYDRIIGIENAERTSRTRLGLIQVEDRLAGTDGLPGNRFDRKSLQRIALGNRQYLGELWRESVLQLCQSAPGGRLLGSSGPVDVSGACPALAGWNLRDDLGSTGAILFRRFASNLLGNFPAVPTGLQGETRPGSESIFTVPYSNGDPVHTPSGLNVGNPLVGQALADAVTDLEGAGIPLDAELGDFQFSLRGGERIPIHGGPGGLGVFQAIDAPWEAGAGLQEVEHGSSFVMSAHFVGGKCPVDAGTFVTYSQSENPESKHAADYTRAFSRKRWNDAPFCNAEVRRATKSKERLIIRPRRRP